MEEQFIPITLPSKCKSYQNVDPSKIVIRPFKGKEVELLDELNLDNSKKKFLTIITNVLKGIAPENLTSGDAKYIMLWEAINSYGKDYPVTAICENCLQEVEIVCDLTKINVVELPDDFKEPFEVKLSKDVINLRLPTLHDEVEVLNFGKKGNSTLLYSYARTIINEEDLLTNLEMLRDISSQELHSIETAHKKHEHGPDMLSSYKCPLCEYEGKLELPFRFENLLSFRD